MRELSRSEASALFFRHYQQTGDAEEAAYLVYSAGRLSLPRAIAKFDIDKVSAARTAVAKRLMAPVIVAIAARNGVTVASILSLDRASEASGARQECMWIARRVFREPFTVVAAVVDREDHATAIHGVRRVDRRIAASPGLRDELIECARANARPNEKVAA